MTRQDVRHHFRYMNGLPINGSHPDCLVNVLEYTEELSNGKKTRWIWVTDISLSEKTVFLVMRGGRAR